MDKKARAKGCLLGGAVGDALGYQVEFSSYPDILSRYGAQGITDLPNPTLISDDTQMTLFTADGMLECQQSSDTIISVYHSYLRWLKTQNGTIFDNINYTGGLMEMPALYKSRAPGTTCLSALSGGQCGRIDHPINDSKGCGGVMRVAPCAFYDDPFRLGCDVAAITHSHPSGYLSAGVLAQILHELMDGSNIDHAIKKSLSVLSNFPGNEETTYAIQKAISLAKQGNPDASNVEMLGGGWVGEEALAIAIYCALCYPNDFALAVCLAVNHSDDSDSTGAVCGNIMGMMLGIDAIPEKWRETVELNGTILEYADRLAVAL